MFFRTLKKVRVLVSVLILVAITFFFLDFSGLIPQQLSILPDIQLTPSLLSLLTLSATGIAFVVIALVTLLFGRLYCSTLCPLGIFQDVVNRISRRRNKKKKNRKYGFAPAHNILRFSILALTVITLIFGLGSLLTFLDPYSIYGRIATNVFRPVYIGSNNLGELIFSSFNSYLLYHVGINTFSAFTFCLAVLMLLLVAYMSYKHGRLYCNTICPVGSFLGLISKVSLFKIKIDPNACNHCYACERECKSSCIDNKQAEVDFSRCVSCFSCIGKCKKNAIGYRFALQRAKTSTVADGKPEDIGKREFIATAVGSIASIGILSAQELLPTGTSTVSYTKQHPISPPGSTNITHFKSKCTACHACVSRCPSQVIKPAFMQYGIDGLMLPRMDYFASFCNFECTICTEVCPTGALQKLNVEKKRRLQIGRVAFVKENCVVYTQHTDCGACSEHCPTKAVDMVPFEGTLTIPQVNPDICVGCGGCEYICPVRPLRAIYVEGNPIHQQAEAFEEAEKKKVELEEFPF